MPAYSLTKGDYAEVLQNTDQRYDLIFADPPYNVGWEYDSFKDKMALGEWQSYLSRLSRLARECVKPTGSFVLVMGAEWQHLARTRADTHWHWKQTVIWHYTFGPCQRKGKFTPSHVYMHWFVADPKKYLFNSDIIKVPSARQTKYNDKRAAAGGKMPDDVWIIPRVAGTFKERAGYTNQLPLELTDRWVKALTPHGGDVLDPVCGSGTTLVSALRLGRNAAGIDLSQTAIDIAERRIKEKK